MIQLRKIFEQAVRFGASLVACCIVQFGAGSRDVGIGWASGLSQSLPFSSGVQNYLFALSAFLIVWIGIGSLLKSRKRAAGKLIAGGVLFVGGAWALSPLSAAFPPFSAFLCWLACPESFYFPRCYAAPKGGSAVCILLEVIVAFGSLIALAFAMACATLQLEAERHVLLLFWSGVVALVGIAAYVLRMRGRREAPPLSVQITSMLYHSLEIWVWSSFDVMVWFWLA